MKSQVISRLPELIGGKEEFDYARCGLTEKEWELTTLVAQGLSNKEIAEKLYISNNTVKEHFKNIFRKMQVSSRGDMLLKIFINKEGETAKDE